LPAAAGVAIKVGFWTALEKLFGPLQVYAVPVPGKEVRFRDVPEQTGLLLEAVTEDAAFTLTVVVAEPEHPPTKVQVTV
jgi:hypothetical protein